MSIEKAYDNWSSQYDTNKNRTRDMDELATREVLSDIIFTKVLELGCGTGKNSQWLVNRADKILAVDFSANMLKVAREKLADPKISFKKADITKEWTWARETYELITCNLILEHIQNLEPIFEKAASHLAPGGYFFISELHPFKQYRGTGARFEMGNKRIELETYTHHISDFASAAQKNGLRIRKINEWFDEDQIQTPRLISFLFQKA